jgi:hypothetical protein
MGPNSSGEPQEGTTTKPGFGLRRTPSGRRPLHKSYASISNGECSIQIDTPEGIRDWTCTIAEREKASECLLGGADERPEQLIECRKTLLFCQDQANGERNNGSDGPGPLTIEACRELLKKLMAFQDETHVQAITPVELLLIRQFWKAACDPDVGRGVERVQI